MNFLIDLFVKVLTTDAVEKLAETRIVKWYKKYKEFREKVGKVKHVYNLVMNPNNWIKAITTIPRQEMNDFFKELASWKNYYKAPDFGENSRYLYTDEGQDVGMETRPETQRFKPNKDAERKLDEMNKELNGQGKWVNLSSSWIKRGMFKMIYPNKLLGVLSLELKTSNTIYAYPMVPYDVWVLMKEANGQNGTRNNPRGAGSVFWKYWLDKWLPSALRKKVKADFQNNKISKDEYNIALEQVQVSARSFYRSNTAKYTSDELNKDWYKAQGAGKGFRTYRYNTYNNLYTTKYTSQYYEKGQYGFTTHISDIKRHINPAYINKRKQAQAKTAAKNEAKRKAKKYKNILTAQRKLKQASNYINRPENNAKKDVKKAIKRTINKWGKNNG